MERFTNKFYFDHAANTPLAPEVQKVLCEFYAGHYGNAAGIHSFARDMKARLDRAREFFARFLNAKPSEIIFTASATESNNFVLKGLAQRFPQKRHLLISAVEHASVFETARYLKSLGFEVDELAVDEFGRVDPDDVKKYLRPDTLLVSVMWVNNELGTIQPIKEIGKICREAGVFFHSDAVQGFARLPLNIQEFQLDFLSASAHKIYGPLGAGLVYIKEGIRPEPLLHGGGHENELRSSTVNVPAIVGFQKAAEIYEKERAQETERIRAYRQKIWQAVENDIPGSRINSPHDGLPHILNCSFEKVDGELLAIYLDKQGIAVSTGSACSTGKVKGSRALESIHLPPKFRRGTIRISPGRYTKEEEVDYLIEQLKLAVKKVRMIS
ncbi:cysteine desulfurase family protein [Calditrichota bacterium GD2]